MNHKIIAIQHNQTNTPTIIEQVARLEAAIQKAARRPLSTKGTQIIAILQNLNDYVKQLIHALKAPSSGQQQIQPFRVIQSRSPSIADRSENQIILKEAITEMRVLAKANAPLSNALRTHTDEIFTELETLLAEDMAQEAQVPADSEPSNSLLAETVKDWETLMNQLIDELIGAISHREETNRGLLEEFRWQQHTSHVLH